MPQRPKGPAPLWEKPDFEVTSLTDLEEHPGFGVDDDVRIVPGAGGPEADDTVDLREPDR